MSNNDEKQFGAFESGRYAGFTGWISYAGTDGWVENATFELVKPFDYDTLMPGFKFGAVAPCSSIIVPEEGSRNARISDGPYIEWQSGTWLNGTWANGVWNGGDWLDGTWKRGIWRNGDWHGGTWEDGIWYGGQFLGGTFVKGMSFSKDGLLSYIVSNIF